MAAGRRVIDRTIFIIIAQHPFQLLYLLAGLRFIPGLGLHLSVGAARKEGRESIAASCPAGA